MSKKTVRNNSKIRHAKTNKRKNITYNAKAKKPKTVDQRMSQKVKTYMSKNQDGIDAEKLTSAEAIQLCKDKLKDVLYFHYYLIFVQEMIEGEILLSFVMKYDVKRYSMRIRNISNTIANLSLLEESMFYFELIRISEEIKDISLDIYAEIARTDKISRWIDSMIFARGKYLPRAEKERTPEEIYSEVLRITALNYLANNILSIGLPTAPLEHTLENPLKDNK